jgi:predicted nucleic acid-binding protein
MRRQELSGSVQRRGRLVEDRVIGLEDVGHARGDVEGDFDVGGGSLPGDADGVVEENFVRSGMDDQRRQAGQLGGYGADEAESGILPRRVVGDSGAECLWAEQRVEAVRDGRLRMVWDDATHAEIEHVMRQIPRLSWTRIADLFRSEDRFGGSTHPEAFGFVTDPADRKFAALADAVRAPLVTSDAGLLNRYGQMAVPVLKPSEFARRCGALYGESGLP